MQIVPRDYPNGESEEHKVFAVYLCLDMAVANPSENR